MKDIYICTLEGKHVFHDQTFTGCITHIVDLPKVRQQIKEQYKVEFEKLSSKWINGYYWRFDNITDDRDIALVVYKSELIE